MANSIPISPQTSQLADFTYGEFKQDEKALPYRLYSPIVADDAGEKLYPLILWLHDIKARGNDNEAQLKGDNSHCPAYFSTPEIQEDFPCYVLAPQCPKDKFWVNFARNSSTGTLRRAIELMRWFFADHPVDVERLYVAGQSMGGFATWTLIAEYPELFAAALPMAGGYSARKARKVIRTPVWVFHGAQDPLVQVWRSRTMVEALKKADKPVIYTEFASGKHDIWEEIFSKREVAEWLFSHTLFPISIGERLQADGETPMENFP